MLFNLHINLVQAGRLGFSNVNQVAVFEIVNLASSWAELVVIDGVEYRWVSREKVVQEYAGSGVIGFASDTVYRILCQLRKLGLIDYVNRSHNGVKKDLVRLTDRGRAYYSDYSGDYGSSDGDAVGVPAVSKVVPIVDAEGLDQDDDSGKSEGKSELGYKSENTPKTADFCPEFGFVSEQTRICIRTNSDLYPTYNNTKDNNTKDNNTHRGKFDQSRDESDLRVWANRMAEIMYESICSVAPCVQAGSLSRWSKRLQGIETRQYGVGQVELVWGWVSEHSFWKTRVLSPDIMFRCWSTIVAQMSECSPAVKRRVLTKSVLDIHNTDW